MGDLEVIDFDDANSLESPKTIESLKLQPGSFLPAIYQAAFVEIYPCASIIIDFIGVSKGILLLCKQGNFSVGRKFSTKW
jgi:hypothetical protein